MVARRRQLMPFWHSLPMADGGQVIVVIYTEGVQIKYFFSFSLLILIKPFDGSLGKPLAKRLPGVG
jgi:hypothetical protein